MLDNKTFKRSNEVLYVFYSADELALPFLSKIGIQKCNNFQNIIFVFHFISTPFQINTLHIDIQKILTKPFLSLTCIFPYQNLEEESFRPFLKNELTP
ncbi:hypothetical protein ES708_23317 [subsurface metagenome]